MISVYRSVTSVAMLALVCAAPNAWSAAAVAGKVEVLKGKASALGADGVERKLQRGGPVLTGDQINTEKRASLAVEFKDGTYFALGGDSSMSVDEFVYGKSPEEDTFSAKVLKGAFRFITGLVAKEKPDSMNVQLGGTATIGIRGTNVAGELVGEAATVILLEPEEKGQKTAIEVFNDHGTVTIDEPGFGTEVPDANSPPSPARRMRQQTIENVLRSMSSVTRALSRPRISVP
jgi:hypothetical protein